MDGGRARWISRRGEASLAGGLNGRAPRPVWRGALGVAAVALGLTLVMAAPVLRDPTGRLFGSELAGRHPDVYFAIHHFQSPRAPGLLTQPATDYPGALVAALAGDGVVAYNAVVLTSFPLAALFAYLLALRLSGSRPAAWVAGLFYAFAPFHVAHAAYHPHGAQTQWLPLYLLALWLSLARPGVARLGLLAASAALVALSNFYYGLVAALLTPLALVAFWLVQGPGGRRPVPRGLAATALVLALLAALGIGYVAMFAPRVLTDPASLAFPESDLASYGARWWSYLVPPVENPWLGGLARRVWERHGLAEVLEQQVSLGLGLVALAAVALACRLRGERGEGLAVAPALAAVALGALLLSRAPDGEGLDRPAELIYGLLPMFRAYARFGLAVILMGSVLAGLGAARLLRGGLGPKLAAVALLAVAVLELTPLPPFRWRHALPTEAHRWLDERPPPVRLMSCVPAGDTTERALAAVFAHPISVPGAARDCGDPDFSSGLSAQGFTHLLAYRDSPLGEWLARREPPLGLAPIGDFADSLLFEVERRPPPSLRLEFAGGFHWREFDGSRTYRWMGRQGSLALINATGGNVEQTLEVTLGAFPESRAVELRLDGAPLAELEVAAEPRPYRVGPLALAPGRHRLTLRSRTPAVVADRVLGNGDPRELALAIHGWRWLAGADAARGSI